MGASQSRSDGGAGQDVGDRSAQTCYYELLDIGQNASEDEIKKAYRRKALELHPDRNLNQVEAATRQFAEVQSAYEVLSDPQERAWYDSHRDVILHGEEGGSDSSGLKSQGTTTSEVLSLIGKFNGRLDFSDSPTGFFGGLKDMFAKLAQEEEAICRLENLRCPSFPSFAEAATPYADGVRPFYTFWANFSTNKMFSWKDVYRLSDAPDRRIRRLMEKENKKLRDEAIRDYNDAVRSLVAFAKKRDPRVPMTHESEIDRQRILRDATATQATRSKLAHQAKIGSLETLPEWMRVSEPAENEISDEEQPNVKESIECVVCSKVFKSEKQFQAHERSKKHLKAVTQIQKEMQQDAADLGLSDVEDSGHDPALSSIEHLSSFPENDIDTKVENSMSPSIADLSLLERQQADISSEKADGEEESSSDSTADSKYSPETTEEGAVNHTATSENPKESPCQNADHETPPTQSRVGKAKLKRARKAAKAGIAFDGGAEELQCVTCHNHFPSKTKLFTHIRELNHAQAPTSGARPKRKKGRPDR